MAKNRNALLMLILSLVFSVTGFAQFGGPPGGGGRPDDFQNSNNGPKFKNAEERIDEELAWMKKKLKLSNAQLGKVANISAKYAYAQDDLMPKPGNFQAKPDEFRKKTADLTVRKDAEMRDVLDEKQYKKYLKNRTDFSKELANNRPAGGGPPQRGGAGGNRPSFNK